MQEFYSLITDIGLAKLTNAQFTQSVVQITHVAVGDSKGAYYEPVSSATSLKNEVWRGAVSGYGEVEGNPNWRSIELNIPAQTGGWTVREVGLFDSDGDMIAISKYPASYKPAINSGSTKDMLIKVIIAVTNPNVLDVKVDPTVIIASRKYVDDKLDGIKTSVDNINEELQGLNLEKAHSGKDFEAVTDGYSSAYSGLRFRPLQDYILKSVQVKSQSSGEIGIEIYKVYDNTNFELYYSKTSLPVGVGITTLELDCYIEVGNYDYLIVKNVDSNISLAYISGTQKFTDAYNEFKGSFDFNGMVEWVEKISYDHFYNWTLDLSFNKNVRRVESKLNEHSADDVKHVTTDEKAKLADYNFSVTSTDANGKPIQTQYKRKDNTLYLQVDASNPNVNGNYQTVENKYYDTDGTTLLKTVTWTLTYNVDGLIIGRSWAVA